MLYSLSALESFTIGATDGDIGRVDDFYFDDQSFTIRHLVVDASSWLLSRKVLVSPISLVRVDVQDERIQTTLTKAQIEGSPDVSTDRPVSRQHELALYDYYGFPPYWTGPYLWGPVAYPSLALAPDPRRVHERERQWQWRTDNLGDEHLRSANEVIEYYIQARDQDIGHVEDFLVDADAWTIHYLAVDTRNWWPGKKVLVSPEWVRAVSWNDGRVQIDLTAEQIRNSPEWDPTRPIDLDYETRLHEHYGRPRYWSDSRRVA